MVSDVEYKQAILRNATVFISCLCFCRLNMSSGYGIIEKSLVH